MGWWVWFINSSSLELFSYVIHKVILPVFHSWQSTFTFLSTPTIIATLGSNYCKYRSSWICKRPNVSDTRYKQTELEGWFSNIIPTKSHMKNYWTIFCSLEIEDSKRVFFLGRCVDFKIMAFKQGSRRNLF